MSARAATQPGGAIQRTDLPFPLIARGSEKPRGVIVMMDEQTPAAEQDGTEDANGAEEADRAGHTGGSAAVARRKDAKD